MAAKRAVGRPALSLTTYFYAPELEMRGLEVLARGSAVMLPHTDRKHLSDRYRVHVLASSHVVSPWRYRNYYPMEWLDVVGPNNTICVAEFREQDGGSSITQLMLSRRTFHHPELDLAVLEVAEREMAIANTEAFGMRRLNLRAADTDLVEDEPMAFHGHLIDAAVDPNDPTAPLPEPQTIQGVALGARGDRIFVRPSEELTEGMCGGPITDADMRFVGLLEGTIPQSHPSAPLRGVGVAASWGAVRAFLERVEAGGEGLGAETPDVEGDKLAQLFDGDSEEQHAADVVSFLETHVGNEDSRYDDSGRYVGPPQKE